MFDRQPALLKSNIYNIADESEKVLGFFTMSGVQEARAFAEEIPGLDHKPNPHLCKPVCPGARMRYVTTLLFWVHQPVITVYAEVNHHYCREYKGSSAIKPDFW